MKAKFYKNIAAFIVILSVILFGISWTLKQGHLNFESRANYKMRGILNEHSIDAQIMIFGSSVAEGGIAPDELSTATSKTVYNAALSGRRAQDWSALAYEYLGYNKKCEVLIFSVFPNSFNALETIYQPHEFYPYLGNSNVRSALGDINPMYTKMSMVPFYHLNHLNSVYIKDAISGWKSKLGEPTQHPEYHDGYTAIPSEDFKAIAGTIIPVDTSKVVTSIYEQMMYIARQKDIKVVFIGTPVYAEGMAMFKNTDHIYKQCEIWAKQEGVYFFNHAFDADIVRSTEYFANNTHLNKIGAILLSQKVGKELKTVLRND